MINYIRRKIMAFKDIFKDDNDYNEKNVIGFLSFAVMVVFALGFTVAEPTAVVFVAVSVILGLMSILFLKS